MAEESDIEKLASIKPLLRDVLDDILLALDLLESFLNENLKKVEDVRDKKEECQIVVDIGRLLREFPRKANDEHSKSMRIQQRNEIRATSPASMLPFLAKIDTAFDTVRSKLDVVSDFIGQTQSLSFGLTLAIVLKDIKMVIAKEEMIEEELPRRQSFAKGGGIEALQKLTSTPPASPSVQRKMGTPDQLQPNSPNSSSNNSSPLSSSPAVSIPVQLLRQGSSGSNLSNTPPSPGLEEGRFVVDEDSSAQVKTPEEAIQQMAKALVAERKRSLKRIRPRSSTVDVRKPLSETLGDMLGNDTNLSAFLRDPTGTKFFRAFLKHERSDENLDFLEAVAKWPPGDKKKATDIYESYVKDGCAREVNLSSKYKKELEQDIVQNTAQVLKPDVFVKAEFSVMTTLQEDSFKRFLKSDEFKQYTKSQGYKKISGKKAVKGGGALDDILIALENSKI